MIGIGVALSVAAIAAIYVTSVSQNAASNNVAAQSTGGSSSSSQTGQQSQVASGQNSTQGASSGGGSTNTITIPQGAQSAPPGKAYLPNNAQVSPGAKVTWQNTDSVTHTATAKDKSFDTGNIAAGSSGSATVKGQGKIEYFCTIHPTMTGTLTVAAGSGGNSASGGSTGQSNGNSNTAGNSTQSGGGSGNATSQTGGQGSNSNPEGFTFRHDATAFVVLPSSRSTDLGTEEKNKNNWITANHDIFGTRSSSQTTISKDNVGSMHPKWILNTAFPIETPPLIIGNMGYAQNNAMQIIAFDMDTGLNKWTFDPGVADKQTQEVPRGVFSHGMTYDKGVIFAPTGANGTVVAVNATSGKLLWQSAAIGDPSKGFRLPSPPIVWKDFVVVGSALGDEPPFAPAAKGTITAFNRTNGERIWNISTAVGDWIEGKNAEKNGGGTVWSGGSLDPNTGIMYVPTGNAAPDFDPNTRPPPNPYTNSILAVDVAKGRILWHTQTTPYNTHDWDTAWGTSLAQMTSADGTVQKVVMGQNKLGNAFALDAMTGHVLWNNTLGVLYQATKDPSVSGSGTVWPGTQYGVEAYNANDGNLAYFAVSNMGFNYFKSEGGDTSGHLAPVFDAIENGIGNGTINAVDIKSGEIKWTYPTEFPTWVSPLVTNGVVFSGHITATGKPYAYNDFGAPTDTPLIPSGIILALDANSGQKLWEYNVGAPIGIGGPSIGHGTLLVTTGSPAEVASNKGGYIVAFGLDNAQPAQDAQATASTAPAAGSAQPAANDAASNRTATVRARG